MSTENKPTFSHETAETAILHYITNTNWRMIEDVSNPTDKMISGAIRQSKAKALSYFKKAGIPITNAMLSQAISHDPLVVFEHDATEKHYILAIEERPELITRFESPTFGMFKAIMEPTHTSKVVRPGERWVHLNKFTLPQDIQSYIVKKHSQFINHIVGPSDQTVLEYVSCTNFNVQNFKRINGRIDQELAEQLCKKNIELIFLLDRPSRDLQEKWLKWVHYGNTRRSATSFENLKWIETDLAKEVLAENKTAFDKVLNQYSDDVIMLRLETSASKINMIDNPSIELQRFVIGVNPKNIAHIKTPADEIIEECLFHIPANAVNRIFKYTKDDELRISLALRYNISKKVIDAARVN